MLSNLSSSFFVVIAEVMVATKWDPQAFAASLPGANQRGATLSGDPHSSRCHLTLTRVAEIAPGIQEDDPQSWPADAELWTARSQVRVQDLSFFYRIKSYDWGDSFLENFDCAGMAWGKHTQQQSI